MQFLTSLFVIATVLATYVSACLRFNGNYDYNSHRVTGTLNDRGEIACTINTIVSGNIAWFNCDSRFHSWISADMNTLAYAPGDYRITVTKYIQNDKDGRTSSAELSFAHFDDCAVCPLCSDTFDELN